jgi:hypothetical protein
MGEGKQKERLVKRRKGSPRGKKRREMKCKEDPGTSKEPQEACG